MSKTFRKFVFRFLDIFQGLNSQKLTIFRDRTLGIIFLFIFRSVACFKNSFSLQFLPRFELWSYSVWFLPVDTGLKLKVYLMLEILSGSLRIPENSNELEVELDYWDWFLSGNRLLSLSRSVKYFLEKYRSFPNLSE